MKKSRHDAVIITVGTKEQKSLCKKLISDSDERYVQDSFVVCDEDFGCRIGSGGALLSVIEKYYEQGKKLLVINSGGMSKRSVNYAVRGKLFANLMVDGNVISLLELLIKNGKRLLAGADSGVVVCCSDILVDTENFKNDFKNNFGIAVKTDYKTGSRHGVMFFDDKKILQEYPHKTSEKELERKSAEYGYSGVFVDTGIIYFKEDLCLALKKCATENKIINTLVDNKIDLNLYPDIVASLAKKICKEISEDYQNEKHAEVKKVLLQILSDFSLEVAMAEGQDFVHFGSLRESLENIFAVSGKENYLLINSYISEKSVIEKNTMLDNVILKKGCVIGENCIVSDITFEDEVKIENSSAVCGIKLCDGSYVAIVCDINENPKEKLNGKELWDVPRFYKGKSYTDSFKKFISKAEEEKFSLSYCTENADVNYYFSRCKYIKDMNSYQPNKVYLKKREEIINKYFSKKQTEKFVSCEKEKAEISLPVRVNISGTWTDAMPYCVDNGGQVVNMAITVDGEKPIKVIAEKLEEKIIEFCSDGTKESYLFDEKDDLSDFNLHKAVLETMGINKETVLKNGFRLTTEVKGIDKGSGLGTSSILLGGCFKALGELFGFEYEDEEIFEMVFVAEQIMRTGGGWQDQAGGLLPGMKIATTESGLEQKLQISQLELSENFKNFISEKFVLVPTGQRHFGRFIVSDVVNRYLAKNENSLQAHKKIRKLNDRILNSIENDNFQDFLNCVNEHFYLLKEISPLVSNEKIDSLTERLLEDFADAVSVCGAGGGGYLLAVMKDGVSAETLKNNFGEIKKIDLFV